MVGIALYLSIFFAKIIEVTIATVRLVLISKGEKKVGSILAFFEISLWMVIVSNVLDNLSEDPMKMLAYALGFSIGNYMGSMLEAKLGLGNTNIMVIINKEDRCGLIEAIREMGVGVTSLSGEGKDSDKSVLMIIAKRKSSKGIINLIKSKDKDAFITISDSKPMHGGLMK